MKKYLAALICLPAFLGLAHASTITVFDSLGASDDMSFPVYVDGGYNALYASFSTLNPDFALDDVQVTLLLPPATSPSGTLHVELWSDSGTAPGTMIALLGTISDTSLTTSPTNFDIPVSPMLLAPGRYWIGLSSTDGSSAQWSVTFDTSGTGVASEWFGDATPEFFPNLVTDQGDNNYSIALKMQVNGYDVPEPATFLLGGLGLALLAGYRRRVAS